MNQRRNRPIGFRKLAIVCAALFCILFVTCAGIGMPRNSGKAQDQGGKPPAQEPLPLPASQTRALPIPPPMHPERPFAEWDEKPAPPTEKKTAGEYYKNVQILKDMPAPNLMAVMKYFCGALYVRCEHCHVVGEWSRDDKPEKQTARKMLNMAGAIQGQYFPEKQGPTCWTCHRGNVKPEF
jgi:hypothetical protein